MMEFWYDSLVIAASVIGLGMTSLYAFVKILGTYRRNEVKLEKQKAPKNDEEGSSSKDFLKTLEAQIDQAPTALKLLEKEEAELKKRGPLTKEQQDMINAQRHQLETIIKYQLPFKLGAQFLGPAVSKRLVGLLNSL